MGSYKEKCLFNFFVDSPKDIKDGTQQMMRKLFDYIVESDYAKVDRALNESKPMKYSIQGYEEAIDIEDDIKRKLISAGYASALIDAMQLYVEKINAQNEIFKVNTKYKNMILEILAKRGTLLHGDLASALGISPSGLNAVIKQMNGTSVKLISVEKISKYKLYSITPIAYKYIMKQEQDYPQRKDILNLKQDSKEYLQILRYKELRFYDAFHIEYCQKRDVEGVDIGLSRKLPQTTVKYGDRMAKNAQIIKNEKILAKVI